MMEGLAEGLGQGVRDLANTAGRCLVDARRATQPFLATGQRTITEWIAAGRGRRAGGVAPAVRGASRGNANSDNGNPSHGVPASIVPGGGVSGRDLARLALLVPAGLLGLETFGGFPDRDIELIGIGAHRFFLFHSGVAIAALEKLYRDWALLEDRGRIERLLKKLGGVALGGAAFGVGLHLLVDVFHPKTVVFPLIGSLIDGTMLDDTLWLLGNAIWCFKMSHDVIVLAAGEDVAHVSELIRRRLPALLPGRA